MSNGSLVAGSMIMDFAIIAAGPKDTVPAEEPNLWTRWLRRPQNVWLRRALFQIHLWTGIGTGLYVLLISITGSAIVFRNEIYQSAGADARKVEVRGVAYVLMRERDLHAVAAERLEGADDATGLYL